MTDTPPRSFLRSPTRSLDPFRDAVAGPAGLQERHRLARLALLEIIMDRWRDFWAEWCRKGKLGKANARAIVAFEALAETIGLPTRGALWDGDDRAYRERRDAILWKWIRTTAPLLLVHEPAYRGKHGKKWTPLRIVQWRAAAEALHLQQETRLDARSEVEIRRVDPRWAARFKWFLDECEWLAFAEQIAYVKARPVVLQLAIDRQGETTIRVRQRAGESTRVVMARMRDHLRMIADQMAESRMPKGSHYIRQSVAWLVRNRLDLVSLSKLSDEYTAAAPRDARSYIRESIERADAWLHAVPDPTGLR
jgi:hypothetical protein